MKTLLGLVSLLIVALAGGLYFRTRPIEQRVSDWQRVKHIQTAIRRYIRQLFATTAVEVSPNGDPA